MANLLYILTFFIFAIKNSLQEEYSSQENFTNTCEDIEPSKNFALIVGGSAAYIKDFPHLAFFYNHNGVCGSTIITTRVVMTAAHCFDSNRDPEKMLVIAGRTRVGRKNCITSYPKKNVYGVCRYTKHKSFNRKTGANDIALILLNRRLEFSDKIKKGFLPGNNFFLKDKRTGRFLVAGWGITAPFGNRQQDLLKTKMSLASQQWCRQVYNMSMLPEMFCLIGRNTDTCSGDSGGGVIYKGLVVGIVSFGLECASGNPSVYTNVFHYKPWVWKTLKEMSADHCCDFPKWTLPASTEYT